MWSKLLELDQCILEVGRVNDFNKTWTSFQLKKTYQVDTKNPLQQQYLLFETSLKIHQIWVVYVKTYLNIFYLNVPKYKWLNLLETCPVLTLDVPPQFAIPVTTKTNWTGPPRRRKTIKKGNTTVWRCVSFITFLILHWVMLVFCCFFWGACTPTTFNIFTFLVHWPAVAHQEKPSVFLTTPSFNKLNYKINPSTPWKINISNPKHEVDGTWFS